MALFLRRTAMPLSNAFLFCLLSWVSLGCGIELSSPVAADPSPHTAALNCGELGPGARLTPGEQLKSCGGRTLLAMQGDGNLVVYSAGGKALWSSGTQNHPGSKLAVQDDGNVVVYSPGGQALWWSGNTPAHAPCGLDAAMNLTVGQTVKSCNQQFGLVMQDDGNLVLYGNQGNAVWASGTHGNPGSASRGFWSRQLTGSAFAQPRERERHGSGEVLGAHTVLGANDLHRDHRVGRGQVFRWAKILPVEREGGKGVLGWRCPACCGARRARSA